MPCHEALPSRAPPATMLPASSMALLLSRQLDAASASLLVEGEREVPRLYPETETMFPRLPASGKGMMDGHALWSPDSASLGLLWSWTLSGAHRTRRGAGPLLEHLRGHPLHLWCHGNRKAKGAGFSRENVPPASVS